MPRAEILSLMLWMSMTALQTLDGRSGSVRRGLLNSGTERYGFTRIARSKSLILRAPILSVRLCFDI
jgi:hypothetical protein